MNLKQVTRDVGGPLILAVATAGGLFGLFGASWPVTVPAALVVGAGWVLLDMLVYQQPIAPTAPGGRAVAWSLGLITALAALALAFGAGRAYKSEPTTYAFLVVSDNPLAEIYAAPYRNSGTTAAIQAGQTVHIDCFVTGRGGPWYRVSDNGGWITGNDVIPGPYSGEGDPPECPS